MSVWSSISGEGSFLQSQTTSLRKLAESVLEMNTCQNNM